MIPDDYDTTEGNEIKEEKTGGFNEKENKMVSHDLHPSEELCESTNWNMSCIFYAAALEVLVLIVYTTGSVFGFIFALGFLPLALNITWLLLPYRLKRKAVISNGVSFTFYSVQALLFCMYVGIATYFIASTFSYPWTDAYLWSNMWLMSSTLLSLAGILAALHTYSWTMLVFKYRRHLRRTKKSIEAMTAE